ncbi:putative metallo-hydrolase [compost metagenome]
MLDYDPKSGRTKTESADKIVARVAELGASVEWILETHLHADHLTAAQYLKRRLGGKIGIGNRIKDVQKVFSNLFHTEAELSSDSDQFDILFNDNDTFHIGSLTAQALHTPGHTPACMTYLIQNEEFALAFVGDTLFMPDYGTARCDFPGGDARTLFRSINKILALPESTKIFMCHDYRPNGRALAFISSVKVQKHENIHVREGITEDTFVSMREKRDATLDMPVLILPSVQINMRGGNMPELEENGIRYLKIPLNTL